MEQENGDEKFEGFLAREARVYNAPPAEVPRDAMWAAIQSARARSAAAPRIVDGRAGSISRRPGQRVYAWVGIAASLVVGVAIGRFALAPGAAGTVVVPAIATVAANPSADTASTSYRVATAEHLARAEALLTAFGSSSRDAATDKQLSTWARDVLSNTRLLLDSPAARDPSRKALLEDLELVLVAIVQRSPSAGASEERTHVDRTLERTQVLPRLRSQRLVGLNSGT
jgi:hypothetical protein